MRRYKPYPAYKDSGVEWLGQVPEHWEVVPLKRLFQCQDGKRVPLNSEQRADIKGDIPYWGSGGVVDYIDQHIFDETLILLGEDGAPFFERDKPVAYVIEGKAWINNHIHVLKPFDEKASMWLVYYLNSVEYRNYIDGSTRDKLTQDDMKTISILLPTLPEILSIVCYLDRETARIDSLVAAKTRFIELLQEKRQSLITRAVTKGLDPKVKMKDSGVEWLGQVPEHWEISAIKHWFTTTSGGTPDTKQQDRFYTEDGGTPWIRTTDLNNGRLDEFEISITDDAIKETACSIVPCGSVLVAMYGGAGTIGKNALLKIDACINQALCALLPNRFFDDEYTFLYVQFYKPYWMIDAESSRKDPNINQDLVKNAKIMRPSINEQHDIVEYINRKTTRIDALIEKTQRSIELLKERRSALITAAVTGKIDLREAAV